MLRISPSPPATYLPRHPPHILNTALIYVQIDDAEHYFAKSQSNYFWVSKKDLYYSSLIHAMWNGKGDLNEDLYSMCKKLSFIGNLLGTFWRSLLKKQDSIA